MNGQPYETLVELSPDSLNYTFPVEPNTEYCLYIEAISNGSQRPSTSNASCIETVYPEVIDYNYISSVTTLNDQAIEINILQDLDAVGTTYELFKSRDNGSFQSKGTYAQAATENLTVVDEDVMADQIVYRYKAKAVDGCGTEISESNIARNMVLTAGTFADTLINSLQWNSYNGWDGGVTEYQIFRRLGSEDDFTLYASTVAGSNSFAEDVTDFLESEGEFCYKVRAVEAPNQFGISAFSESNVACATQAPLMWIPSAIVLGGFNNVFFPVAGFIDFDSYSMEIINKWGEQLFLSDEIGQGWDGNYKGRAVPEDLYQYIITYRDGSGKPYVEQGLLHVRY